MEVAISRLPNKALAPAVSRVVQCRRRRPRVVATALKGSLAPPLLLLVALVACGSAWPRHGTRSLSPPGRPNFVGEGTNELATLILQGYVDTDKNLAVSPLGYSATLAILAEGAGGETRKQLEAALHLPDDRDETRVAYRTVLERLREKNVVNKPELRNWFYVYKNHSVEAEYREVLRQYYLTDVKTVSRPEADMGFQEMGKEEAEGEEDGTQPPGAALEEAMTLGAMKEGALIESALQEEQTRLAAEQTRNENDQQEDEAPMQQEQAEEAKPMEEPTKDKLVEFAQQQVQENEQLEAQKNPMSEDMPKSEDKPMTEDMPMAEDKPMAEDMPMAEDKPMAADMTMAEGNPMDQEKPMAEDKPKGEEKPMDEMMQEQQKEGCLQEKEPTKEEEAEQEEGEMMMMSDRRKQRELEEAAGGGVGERRGL
ncbi:hypothetical protein R5R35_007544 [Gryllus longicercus]|uniref:Serpin domain-containing protein n=1 Tax=Gryllus longicercus TaxID=2509291 RepID=A0AAN9VYU5_9ORTH